MIARRYNFIESINLKKKTCVLCFSYIGGVSITPTTSGPDGPRSEKCGKVQKFTLNNYTDDDIERLANPYEQVKFIAYGKEIAPTTETPHLQGYICCWEPQRMTFFKRQIPRAHMEPMRGRLQDNDKYIEKEGDLTTWGQKPDQGRRSDIVGLKRKIMEGHHPMDLAIEDEGFTEKKEGTGDFFACLIGGIRLGESLIEQQDNTRASRHGARA